MDCNALSILPRSCLLLLAVLPACASAPSGRADSLANVPQILPLTAEPRVADAPAAGQEDHAPKQAEWTAGIGITDSPVSTLFGASYDIPVHSNITVGPSVHWGYGEDVDLFGAEAKGKFFFAPFNESFQAFASAGGGFGMVDKTRVDEDWGLLFSVGGGLRIKTSTHGMLSSEVNLYVLPEDLAGEDTYYGWQIVQFSFVF